MRMDLMAAAAISLVAFLQGCAEPPPTTAEARLAVTEVIEKSRLIYVRDIVGLEKTDGISKNKEGIVIYQMFANATFDVHEGGQPQHRKIPVQIEFEAREKGWHISQESAANLTRTLEEIERNEMSRRASAEKELRQLCRALALYRMDYGVFPTQEEGLRALTQVGKPRPYTQRTTPILRVIPIDPWFSPYVYELKDGGRRVHIRSLATEIELDCD